MSDKESFERWWAGVEGPEYTPEVQKEINDRHGGEFRYGWLDPIQRATLLIERGAEAAGVPGAAQLAREQEARIRRREAAIDPESGYVLAGQLLSPVPIAVAKAGINLLTKIPYAGGLLSRSPKVSAAVQGGIAGATAPADTGEYYWSDVGGQTSLGALFGPIAYGAGSALNPRITRGADALLKKGVNVPAELATTGHLQDFLGTAHSIGKLVGITDDTINPALNLQFNKALANDILSPFGIKATGNDKHELSQLVTKITKKAYDDAYAKVGTVLPDNLFIQGVQVLRSQAKTKLNKKTYAEFNRLLHDNIIRRFDVPTKNQGRAITGESLKDMRKFFNNIAYEKYDPDIDHTALQGFMRKLNENVDSYLDRVDTTGAIKTANKAYAEASVYHKAVSNSTDASNAFSAQDLERAVKSESDVITLAHGKGKLQQTSRPYIETLQEEKQSPLTTMRKLGVASTLAAGSALAYAQNPAIAGAILLAAGITPAVIDVVIHNPNKLVKVLGVALQKIGPAEAANIRAQYEAREREQLRKEIDLPSYVTD